MNNIQENNFARYPTIIPFENNTKVNEQMEKCIAKVKFGEEQATAFFTKIPFPSLDKKLSVLILTNHTLNPEFSKKAIISLSIKSENKIINIDINGRKYYTDKDYDITIIELKEYDKIKHFLELDDLIINDIINDDEKNFQYIDQTIYIIQYPEGNLSVSYGIIDSIYEDKKYDFNHRCNTRKGSSGSPILNLKNKIVGIHKEGAQNYNIGTFLNYPIKEFIQQNFNFKKNNIQISMDKNHQDNKNDISYNLLSGSYISNGKKNKRLNLSGKCRGNNEIELITKYNWEGLKELNADSNNLNNINFLYKIKCNDLEILSLNNNNISDIKILSNIKLTNLNILSLNKNKIFDFSVLQKVDFIGLKQLFLSSNEIININFLENVNFPKLEILYLDNNKISDISILSKVNFNDLKELYLFENNISDIKVFQNVKFINIKILSLRHNNISDISGISKFKIKDIKKLYLNENKISDISELAKTNFAKIYSLNLSNNIIDKEHNEGYYLELKSKTTYFEW